MASPDDGLQLGAVAVAAASGAVLGISVNWLLTARRTLSRSARFVADWISGFVAYFFGLGVAVAIAGPRVLETARPASGDRPLTAGVATVVAAFVGLLLAVSLAYHRSKAARSTD